GPVALVLTRQKLPTLDREGGEFGAASGVARGGYVLKEASGGEPRAILISTGSEVHVTLEGEGTPTRVVSMPCWELFERQPAEYREAVLPPEVTARVAVEAAAGFGWER